MLPSANTNCDRKCSAFPNLVIINAASAIKFYQELFDAKEMYRIDYQGKIMHAEIMIGCTTIMLSDEMPEMKPTSATTIKDAPFSLYVYVSNVDETFNRAIKMGCRVLYPLETTFYGERMGAFRDPFGFQWVVAKHIEDISEEELKKRMEKVMQKSPQTGGVSYQKKYLKYKMKYKKLLENK